MIVAGKVDYSGSVRTDNKAGPVEDTHLYNEIFDEVYEQYQNGHITIPE